VPARSIIALGTRRGKGRKSRPPATTVNWRTQEGPSDLPAFDGVFMTHLLAAEPVVDAIADRL